MGQRMIRARRHARQRSWRRRVLAGMVLETKVLLRTHARGSAALRLSEATQTQEAEK